MCIIFCALKQAKGTVMNMIKDDCISKTQIFLIDKKGPGVKKTSMIRGNVNGR
jgi:Na+-transporting NADH:ubiquinone oxidoreductase subunit NqrA